MKYRFFFWFCSMVFCLGSVSLSGCSSKPSFSAQKDSAPKHIPKHLDKIKDPVPKVEPLSRYGNRFKNSNSYVALKRRYTVMPSSRGYRAKGNASWYGTKFHGRRTSSGETYDMFAMTAAHKTLPLPTYAKVTNLKNGKSIIVRVNDRGPFHNNRLIDLSYAAAHKLGILGHGTGQVEVESVDPRDHCGHAPGKKTSIFARMKPPAKSNAQPAPASQPSTHGAKMNAVHAKKEPLKETQKSLYLQVGAFRQKAHAEKLREEIGKLSHYPTAITHQTKTNPSQKPSLFRVRIGPFHDPAELQEAKMALTKAKLPTPVYVKAD